MTAYDVVSDNAKSLRLLQGEKQLGTLQYQTWALLRAIITLPDNSGFEADKKGFWDNTIEIRQHENVVLSYDLKWNMAVALSLHVGDDRRTLLLKKAGTFRSDYQLLDETGQELLRIEPDFKWRNVRYDYRITATDAFAGLARQQLLLLTVVHCIRYLVMMMNVIV